MNSKDIMKYVYMADLNVEALGMINAFPLNYLIKEKLDGEDK